jgi:hypothetical protein
VIESRSKHDVALDLDEALGPLQHHLRNLHVTRRGLVEGRGDHLRPHRPLEVRDLLRALVDEQHDEVDLRVVLHHRVGDGLEHHRLARARRRDDQPSLSAPSGDIRSMTRPVTSEPLISTRSLPSG